MGETQLAPHFDVRSESIEVSVPVGTSASAVAPTADNVVPCTADQTEQTAKAFYKGDDRARPTVDKPGVINRATAHALARPDAVDSGANYEYYIMNVPRGF
jgi:hypothetical protein